MTELGGLAEPAGLTVIKSVTEARSRRGPGFLKVFRTQTKREEADPEENLETKEHLPDHGRVRSPEHPSEGSEGCQILYFLPILSNVKVTFKIFKLKLLEWSFA